MAQEHGDNAGARGGGRRRGPEWDPEGRGLPDERGYVERPEESDEEDFDPLADAPEPGKDPRLEIPELLRTPVQKPASLREAELAAERRKAGGGLPDVAKALALGFNFVGSVLAGAVLGWLFDRWRGTAPAGLLIGLAVGFLTAIIGMLRYAMKAERDGKRK